MHNTPPRRTPGLWDQASSVCFDRVENSISAISSFVISLSIGGLGVRPAYDLYCRTTGLDTSKVSPGTQHYVSSSSPTFLGYSHCFVYTAIIIRCMFLCSLNKEVRFIIICYLVLYDSRLMLRSEYFQVVINDINFIIYDFDRAGNCNLIQKF